MLEEVASCGRIFFVLKSLAIPIITKGRIVIMEIKLHFKLGIVYDFFVGSITNLIDQNKPMVWVS